MKKYFHPAVEKAINHLRNIPDTDSADRLEELDSEFCVLAEKYPNPPRSAEVEERMVDIFEETKLLMTKSIISITVKPIFNNKCREIATRA